MSVLEQAVHSDPASATIWEEEIYKPGLTSIPNPFVLYMYIIMYCYNGPCTHI